ncbi:MAG: hypothetical protein A2202_04090 [Bdellovibrionales bacterium RIFOXYA1_FULL_36_14]|nr:MAG: hypothetical protein A2202_04090 [Bdellovibrionales bacterium RIFOXYA1_FULL_36_14]
MITNLKIQSNCIKCDMCKILCPENAIIKVENEYFLETWACSLCNICVKICPTDSIKSNKECGET